MFKVRGWLLSVVVAGGMVAMVGEAGAMDTPKKLAPSTTSKDGKTTTKTTGTGSTAPKTDGKKDDKPPASK